MCDVAVYLGHDHVQSRSTVTRQSRSFPWLCSTDSVGRLYRSLPGNMSLSKGHSDSETFRKLAAQIVRVRGLNPTDIVKGAIQAHTRWGQQVNACARTKIPGSQLDCLRPPQPEWGAMEEYGSVLAYTRAVANGNMTQAANAWLESVITGFQL